MLIIKEIIGESVLNMMPTIEANLVENGPKFLAKNLLNSELQKVEKSMLLPRKMRFMSMIQTKVIG